MVEITTKEKNWFDFCRCETSFLMTWSV